MDVGFIFLLIFLILFCLFHAVILLLEHSNLPKLRRFIPSDLASKRKSISQYQAVRTSQTHLQNADSLSKQMLHHTNQVLEKFGEVPICTSRLHRHLEPTGYDIARLLQILKIILQDVS